MGINAHIAQPIGRFAPSPTGELHLGSLSTAIASYCHIKSLGGKWLLRIEDTDIQRCKPEFSELILHQLSALSLHWDDEVIYQSQRSHIYNSYINDVLKPYIYACDCSRKQLKANSIYPRYCLDKPFDFNQYKLRIQLPDDCILFNDGIQNSQSQNPQKTLGDMVIRRDKNSHNIINYILAVSIDDGLQNISHVMRGLDILPLTSAQIAIMTMAGFIKTNTQPLNSDITIVQQSKSKYLNKQIHLPNIENHCKSPHTSAHLLSDSNKKSHLIMPYWYHLPLVKNKQGQKLSKQNLAKPIDTSSEKNCSHLLATALVFLKQPKVDIDTPQRMLAQAMEQWSNGAIK